MECKYCKHYCFNESANDCPTCGTAFPESLESQMSRAIDNIAYNRKKNRDEVIAEMIKFFEGENHVSQN